MAAPIQAVADALNPTTGAKNESWFSKALPLIITLGWLALGAAIIFVPVIPNIDFAKSFWGILGVPVGIYLREAGSPAK